MFPGLQQLHNLAISPQSDYSVQGMKLHQLCSYAEDGLAQDIRESTLWVSVSSCLSKASRKSRTEQVIASGLAYGCVLRWRERAIKIEVIKSGKSNDLLEVCLHE